jgi:hypothetical protein
MTYNEKKNKQKKGVVFVLKSDYYYPDYKDWHQRNLTPIKQKTKLKVWKKSKVSKDFVQEIDLCKQPTPLKQLINDRSYWEKRLKEF